MSMLATPEVQARVRQLAVDVAYADGEAFGNFLAAESERWKQALKSIGLTN